MKITDWRRETGMSQADVAALLGVSQQTFSKYEHGRTPRPEIIQRILKVTHGAVQPNDFYDLPKRKRAAAGARG